MPQVEKHIIKERAKKLRDLGVQQIKKLYSSLQNLETEILIEKDHTGRTLHFCPTIPDQKLAPGTIVPVRITGHTDTHLTAEVIST